MTGSTDREDDATPHAQPGDLAYDLDAALPSLVAVRSRVPETALTAPVLGTERSGNGILIREDGLVLTIGYLVAEAESVWVIDADGNTHPAYVLGYDYESGFGLVRTLQPVGKPVLEIGSAARLKVTDSVVAAGYGGREAAVFARVVGKREFAGYWEYVLDEALFTAPAHPNWGGTALLGPDGKLTGVGSLLVQQVTQSGETVGTNMFVPVDLLSPILDDVLTHGRRSAPPRPWLGFFVHDVEDSLVVAGLYNGCPAHKADVRPGDFIVEVAGTPVSSLVDLFRRIWALGPAGVEVPLTVLRDDERLPLVVRSIDRNERMGAGRIH